VAAAVVEVAEEVGTEVVTGAAVDTVLSSASVVEDEVVEDVVELLGSDSTTAAAVVEAAAVVVEAAAGADSTSAGAFLATSTVGRAAVVGLVWSCLTNTAVLGVLVGHWVTVSVTVVVVHSVT